MKPKTNTLKICAISDLHNQQFNLLPKDMPEADILVIAGDMTGRGSKREFEQFNEWLNIICLKYSYILIIAGNHDFGLDTKEEKLFSYNKDIILDMFPLNCIYLEDEEFEFDVCTKEGIKTIKFYGSPWTPTFHNWAFMKDDIDLAKVWSRIPHDTDVLITHGPPFSILDKIVRDGSMAGSKTLFERVKQLKNLKLHLFGHIHEQAGIENIDDVIFANCSQVNEYYEWKHKPLVFELEVK